MRSRPWTEEERDLVRELHESGTGIAPIAKRLRRATAAVARMRDELGLEPHARGGLPSASRAEDERIRQLHASGMSTLGIAREIGRGSEFTRKRLNTMGLSANPRQVTHTPELDARLVELYVDYGYGLFPVAHEVGRSPDYVRRRLIELGVSTQRKKYADPRLDYETLEKTAALYKRGFSTREVGLALGVSEKAVVYRLRQFGVEIRTRGEAQRVRYERALRECRRQTAEIYAQGHTIAEVAEMQGLSRRTVRSRLRASGVKIRSSSTSREVAARRRARDLNPDLGLMRPAA